MGLGLKDKKKKIIEGNAPDIYYNLGSGPNHPSTQVDKNTNFTLRSITLENIDEAVFREFHRKFYIGKKPLDLILLDAEVATYKFQNAEQFDKIKEYLNLPYFIVWRESARPLFRTSPSQKFVIYTVPTQKPQGLVYEEYIAPAPIFQVFPITLKFLSTFRENTNQLEQQMSKYFENKRNILFVDGERFEIKPANKDQLGTLEIEDREGQGRTLYITTYQLEIIGYLRDAKDIQKREKINTFALKMTEKTESVNGSEEIILSQAEVNIKN